MDPALISSVDVLPGADPTLRRLRLNLTPGLTGESSVTVTVSDGIASSTQIFLVRVVTTQDPGASDIILVNQDTNWRFSTDPLPLGMDGKPLDFTAADFDDRLF